MIPCLSYQAIVLAGKLTECDFIVSIFLDHTKGKYCDECATGAFGDPKQHAGCKPCECNGHGISELDLCHNVTGKCFCKDQTYGDNCEFCTSPLVGNAR